MEHLAEHLKQVAIHVFSVEFGVVVCGQTKTQTGPFGRMQQEHRRVHGQQYAKRHRNLPPKKVFSMSDFWSNEEEDFDVVEVYFALSTELIMQAQTYCQCWAHLREIHLLPAFNDHDICDVLDLSTPGLCFPALERLVCRNQPINRIRLSQANSPRLVSVSISYPTVAIEVFELHLPQSLQEIHLGYAMVHDGKGLSMSIDVAVNPQLCVVNKFATTVFYGGVV